MTSRKPRVYRVVAVSLYEDDARGADRWTELLKRAGWPKASRSLVIREGLSLLAEALADKDEERVFRYFVDRYARRLGPGTRERRHEVTAPASPESDANPSSPHAAAAHAADRSRRRP